MKLRRSLLALATATTVAITAVPAASASSIGGSSGSSGSSAIDLSSQIYNDSRDLLQTGSSTSSQLSSTTNGAINGLNGLSSDTQDSINQVSSDLDGSSIPGLEGSEAATSLLITGATVAGIIALARALNLDARLTQLSSMASSVIR